MSGMPWFRVYSDILTDRKINRICKKTGQTPALVIGVWICLLALANDSPIRGILLLSEDMPVTIEDLEDETGLPREIINQLLDEFRLHGMIDGISTIQIINWTKRQFKSDNVAERVRQHREKRYNETILKRSSIVIESDTESDTDTDTESDTTTLLTAFINASQIPDYNPDASEIVEVMSRAGVTPEIVTEAVKLLQGKKFTITGIKSIQKTAINIAKQRAASDNGFRPASETY